MNTTSKWSALALVMTLAGGAALAQTPIKGDANAGRDKIAMCVGCHGLPEYKTAYPQVYRVPMIGGQNAAYIIDALREYKSGDRTHPSMRDIAASLSEQDMADIAAYYSGLKVEK
jgi:cytochrome c553